MMARSIANKMVINDEMQRRNLPVPGQQTPQQIMQGMPGQNMPMVPGQNMPAYNPSMRPQYQPPVPQPANLQGKVPAHQMSPLTEKQIRVMDAKFPGLRKWWESTKEFFGGTPEEFSQFSKMSPQQQSIMEYLLNLGAFGLNNPQSQYEGFEPIAQQATNQFNQQTVPNLAERFTSMGNSSLSSPLFASQLGQAGAGLQSDLAAQRAQYGQQNFGNIMSMLQLGLNPYAENIHRPAQSGVPVRLAEGFVKGLPAALFG